MSEAAEKYGEDYFMRGVELGLSNYVSYRWIADASLSMVDHAKRFIGMRDGESLMSLGCARGFDVKAFRMRGIEARGYDISRWAIENCDPAVKDFVTNTLDLSEPWDYLWAKDNLEHIPVEELCELLPRMLAATRKKAFFIVPLARDTNGPYLNPLDQQDATHIIRWTLHDWLVFLAKLDVSFIVSGSYRMPLLKLSSEMHPCSCGFLTMTRI